MGGSRLKSQIMTQILFFMSIKTEGKLYTTNILLTLFSNDKKIAQYQQLSIVLIGQGRTQGIAFSHLRI